MSLDLVQDVLFETDDLALFEPMLRAPAEVLGVRHVARCQPKPVWQYPSRSSSRERMAASSVVKFSLHRSSR